MHFWISSPVIQSFKPPINNKRRKFDKTMSKELTAEQISKKRYREILELEKLEHQRKIAVFYSERLSFLWEQYNKLMNLGVIASTGTIVFLIQAILIHKDVREVIEKSKVPLDSNWFVASIICAGIAAILFVVSRWCSQILMERQVYGSHANAVNYFQLTLDGETVLPTALEVKKYMNLIPRKWLLKKLGSWNEFAKWIGIGLILASWICTLAYFWPLITTLGKLPVSELQL